MSQYYNPKRARDIYDPEGNEPFRISRSKIDLFVECSRCFYIDRRLGVGRPPGFPFSLNSAVDTLLKKEFDIHRAKKTAHPMMKAYGLDAVPFAHEKLDVWRENFKGVEYHHVPSNFLVTGAVDDLWKNSAGELHVVDYKATSKEGEVGIDAEWQSGYRNQMEIYQWLMRRNGFTVSDTGYFVYVNGRRDRAAFDGRLEFDVRIIPYTGSDSWVAGALMDARACLVGDCLPASAIACDYCAYRTQAQLVEQM